MFRITILLLAVIAAISCERGRRTGAIQPVAVQPDGPQSRLHHPGDHPLRAVLVLIGLPSKEMLEQQREGKALLGGCVGSPDRSPPAEVCDRCGMWKTDEMKYWQLLPKDFGELAGKNGG